MLLFLLRLLISDFLYLILSDESSTLNDESGDDGYDSRSSSKYSFPAFFCVLNIPLFVLVPWGIVVSCQQDFSPSVILRQDHL